MKVFKMNYAEYCRRRTEAYAAYLAAKERGARALEANDWREMSVAIQAIDAAYLEGDRLIGLIVSGAVTMPQEVNE